MYRRDFRLSAQFGVVSSWSVVVAAASFAFSSPLIAADGETSGSEVTGATAADKISTIAPEVPPMLLLESGG